MTYYFQISKQEMIDITTANLGYSLMHECTVLLTKKTQTCIANEAKICESVTAWGAQFGLGES